MGNNSYGFAESIGKGLSGKLSMKISRAMGFHACHVPVVRLITWLLNGKLTNIDRSDNKLVLKSPSHFLRCFCLSIVTGSRIIRGEVNLWAGIVTFAMLLAGWVPSASEILWPSWHLSSSWFGYTVPMFKYTILEYNICLYISEITVPQKPNSLRSVFKLCWSLHRTFQSQLAGWPPGGINQ